MQTKRWVVRGLVFGVIVGCGFTVGVAASADGDNGAASATGEAPAASGDSTTPPTTPSIPPASASASPQASPTPSESSAPTIAPPPTPKKSKDEGGRARLNGTNWSLDLVRISGSDKEKGKNEKDTVTFGTRTVSSDRLSKAGFPTSNYSVNVGDDGALLVWETMQAHGEGKGVAFWRGEIRGDNMEGILSKQPTGSAPEEFSFTGRQMGAAAPVVEAQPAAIPPTEPAEAQKAKAPKESGKKKR